MKKFTLSHAWLDLEGNFITDHVLKNYDNFLTDYNYSHNNLAFCILFDIFKDIYNYEYIFETIKYVMDNKFESATNALEHLGYIRLFDRDTVPKFIINNTNIPNDKQMKTINEWCKENKVNFNNHITKNY